MNQKIEIFERARIAEKSQETRRGCGWSGNVKQKPLF